MNAKSFAAGRMFVQTLLLVFGSQAAVAVTHTDLTVGAFHVTGNAATPVARIDPVSGARGTLQFGATPSCYGLACSAGGPAAGAYGLAGTPVLSILDYGFSVAGPLPASVPLLVSGIYSNINPLVAGGNTNSGLYVNMSQGSTGALCLELLQLCQPRVPRARGRIQLRCRDIQLRLSRFNGGCGCCRAPCLRAPIRRRRQCRPYQCLHRSVHSDRSYVADRASGVLARF